MKVYAGISNVALETEVFDLGFGISLVPTYAHLMSPNLMAFHPAPPGKPHPTPWVAANGGRGVDITVELSVPKDVIYPGRFDHEKIIWWIAALLRIAHYPHLAVPVISDTSFADAASAYPKPTLTPFEMSPRIVSRPDMAVLQENDLEWVKEVWPRGAELLASDSTLEASIGALNNSMAQGSKSAAMLALWGGLEQLFAPSSGELKFRVSANIAVYLEPPGEERLALFKKVSALYNARSKAAHTASPVDEAALMNTFVITRNALVKMIDEGKVPSQRDFERLLFVQSGNQDENSEAAPRVASDGIGSAQ